SGSRSSRSDWGQRLTGCQGDSRRTACHYNWCMHPSASFLVVCYGTVKANGHRRLRYREVIARGVPTVIALQLDSPQRPLAWCDLLTQRLPAGAWRTLASIAGHKDRPRSLYVLARKNTGRPIKVALGHRDVRKALELAGKMTIEARVTWGMLRKAGEHDRSPK